MGKSDVFALATPLSKVVRCENLHSVKETSEHDNLQTSHVHKINWNFGISTGYTWKKPYKSSTYEVPILQNKLEFDWNRGAKHWNSNFLEFVPTFWNRVGILESGVTQP